MKYNRITQVRAAEILNLSTRQITWLLQKLNQGSMFDLNIPVETLRRWMTANDLWIPRSKRLKRPYQPCYNRDCFGELIQIDGSYHDWFEGRAAKCCLLVYIDDATESCCICASVRRKRPSTICFQPEPILNNTVSLWPFIAINIRSSE